MAQLHERDKAAVAQCRNLLAGMPYGGVCGFTWSREPTITEVADNLSLLQTHLQSVSDYHIKDMTARAALDRDLEGASNLLRRLLKET